MFAQIPIQHRFMVSETIAKCPDRAERFRKILAPKAFAILGRIARLPWGNSFAYPDQHFLRKTAVSHGF